MRIDLERALADVAATVHDDATAERMSGQVRHMVTRVRRRRAVRHTAQGVASVGALAVIGVAATSLGGPLRGPEVAPATASPDATLPSDPAPALSCGGDVPDPTTAPLTLELVSAPDADRGASTTVEAALRNTGGEDVDLEDWVMFELVAVADGRVVGTMAGGGSEEGLLPVDGPVRPGDLAAEIRTTTGFASCDDPATMLRPGGYTLVGRLLADVGDAVVVVASEPLPFTVTEPEREVGALESERALEALLTIARETDGPFPVCGTKPWLDDGMPALELDYVAGATDLAVPTTTLPGGVVLKTTEGRYAIAKASPVARVVLLRDGVVVGVPFLDPEAVVDVDLAAGETQPFDLLTTTALCGTGEGGTGATLPLPAGEYTAIAALDLTVKEIGGPGEEPDGSTYPYTAVSEPVTVTLP